ncbi:cytochrome c biogenesis protein CcsA [Polyangium sp. y55x31]|uniref:cytochrome C assembly family protein n=1 Tax=Polyangium sp. y55x31 TaxID=3042688 RepID=UPI002482B6A4|nr:cytochrome c biogenesis protein CcsA [Polyangium sp. y55x31]MDI1481735.1 cytochrome c biogenesis protein CcsA [Polyangium sp. y55x31]
MTRALSTGTFFVAVLLYGAASALFFLDVARKETRIAASIGSVPPPRRSSWAATSLGVAAAFHLAYVTFASLVARVCPVNSVHFSLSMASILAIAVYLPARRRFRIDAIGVLLAPLGLVFVLGTYFLGQPVPAHTISPAFLAVHVLANLAGTALFLLAGGAAMLYLVQEKRLKKKRTDRLRIGNLPPLEVLDQAVHRFLVAGFPLLTLGVLTGTIWAKNLENGTVEAILRAVLGYATWLVIAAVLILRAAAGWRGRRAAYGTIAGFCCVAAVLVVYLVRPVVELGSPRVGG